MLRTGLYAVLNLILFYKTIAAFTPCQESMVTVRYVTSCPSDEVSWNKRAGKMNCELITQNCAMTLGLNTQNHRFQYHCLINSNRNATVEVCALGRYILGFCAEFNANGALVQENFDANCKQHNPPCPVYYHSAKAYKYQTCYELVYKHRRIEKIEWKIEENDVAEELDKAVVERPTASSICLTGNFLMLLLQTLTLLTYHETYSKTIM